MKLQIVKGQTSQLLTLFVQDTSKTDGSGLTGLAFGTAGLTAYYYRQGAVSATAITLQTMTLGTWATGGFIGVDGTNMPGVYQLGLPDAALATGANSVVVLLKGAANMAPVVLEIQLTDTNVNDGAAFGLSRIDAAVSTRLASASITLAAGAVTVGTNNDKTGYTASTVTDKTGYALTAGERTAISVALLAAALTELAQAQPSATPAVNDALMLLYMDLRNGGTTGSGTETVLNNAGTVIAKRTYTDDGTTLTVNKLVTGP